MPFELSPPTSDIAAEAPERQRRARRILRGAASGRWEIALAIGLAALALAVVGGSSRHIVGLPLAFAVLATAALSAALYYGRVTVARFLPRLSAEGLGLFRIAWALALLHVLPMLRGSVHGGPFPRSEQRTDAHVLDVGPAHWLASHPDVVQKLGTVTYIALILFALGMLARLAYVVAAAGFLALTTAAAMAYGVHDWGLPVLVIVTLVIVPWGDGFGVDEAVRRLRGRPRPRRSSVYGLAIWLPGLLLGIAWLSAADAKLRNSGWEWVTGGAVRYHFVTDAHNQANWGLWIASHPAAAVAASGAGLLFEGAFITNVLFRNPWIRLAFGAGAAVFFAGLYKFQDIHWDAWWMILVAFLPWEPLAAGLRRVLPATTVLIDGSCPLCRRTARVLHSLDWFDRLEFADANDDSALRRLAPSLEKEEALERMAAVRPGCSPSLGLDAYIAIAWSVPLLAPFGLLASVPPLHRIGERVYAAVARRRVRRCRVGACEPGPLVPGRRRLPGAAPSIGVIACVAIVGLIVQQTIVADRGLEKEPLVSNFPMYSYTYPSRSAYDASHDSYRNYRFSFPGESKPLLVTGALRRGLVGLVENDHGRSVEAWIARQWRWPTGSLLVTADRWGFDWKRGRFGAKGTVVLGILRHDGQHVSWRPLA